MSISPSHFFWCTLNQPSGDPLLWWLDGPSQPNTLLGYMVGANTTNTDQKQYSPILERHKKLTTETKRGNMEQKVDQPHQHFCSASLLLTIMPEQPSADCLYERALQQPGTAWQEQKWKPFHLMDDCLALSSLKSLLRTRPWLQCCQMCRGHSGPADQEQPWGGCTKAVVRLLPSSAVLCFFVAKTWIILTAHRQLEKKKKDKTKSTTSTKEQNDCKKTNL